jgi:cell division protein FtsB
VTSQPKGVLVGFEVGSGSPVYLEHHHTTISGQTQKSGKTTGVKAMVARSGMRAVVFLTKRGEIGFHGFPEVQPYYREPKRGTLIDWQYVEAILTATMGEKMKLERSFIINACKGAHSLEDVYQNILGRKEKARRGFDISIYTNLAAYFEIILPQIKARNFATSLPLEKGVNVMNLLDLTEEMQALVIQATLNYIMDRMKGIIAVIPEAWKFIPKEGNPVKLAAERYLRQGAALPNYLWIDSQDLTGVDTKMLKQCNNWLMGFQREINEAEKVAKTAGKKVSYSMIQSLKLGHFVLLQGTEDPQLVYLWPDRVPMQMAIDVALGLIEPEVVKEYLEKLKEKSLDEDEEMYRRKCEELEREKKSLEDELERLKSQKEEGSVDPELIEKVQRLETEVTELKVLKEEYDKVKEELKKTEEQLGALIEENSTLEHEKNRLAGELETIENTAKSVTLFREAVINLVLPSIEDKLEGLDLSTPRGAATPGADVELETTRPHLTLKENRYKVTLTEDSQEGRILLLWVRGELEKGQAFTKGKVRELFEKYGWDNYHARWTGDALKKLIEYGFLETKKSGRRTDYFFTMTPEEAGKEDKMDLDVVSKVVQV